MLLKKRLPFGWRAHSLQLPIVIRFTGKAKYIKSTSGHVSKYNALLIQCSHSTSDKPRIKNVDPIIPAQKGGTRK
jgi:hypothetical protein